MTFPQFTLVNHWQYQPFLLRNEDRRYFVLFSDRVTALKLADLYSLQPPKGLIQINVPWELLAWAKAAEAAGAGLAWIDPTLACQAIDPVNEMPIVELIERASQLTASMGEQN